MIFAHLIQSASSLPSDASALERAISALESAITTLDNSSTWWERLLPYFTAVVAFGVVMEFWVISHGYRGELEAWRRGTIRSPERPPTKKLVVEVVSLILIAGGITGELWVAIKIASLNGALRAKNAELRDDSDQLVGLLRAQIAKASLDEQRLRSDNLILENSLLRLQGRIQWRHIPPEKLPELIKLLSSGPKGVVEIDCISASEDSCPFANEIAQALADSKWPALKDGSVDTSIGSDNSVGEGILVRDTNDVPAFALHLQNAFHAVGIELPGFPIPSMAAGDVTVKIGRKLQPKPTKQSKATAK